MTKEGNRPGKFERIKQWFKEQTRMPTREIQALMASAHIAISKEELQELIDSFPKIALTYESSDLDAKLKVDAANQASLQVQVLQFALQSKLAEEVAHLRADAYCVFSDKFDKLATLYLTVGDRRNCSIEMGDKKYLVQDGLLYLFQENRKVRQNPIPTLQELNEFSSAFSDRLERTREVYVRFVI